MQSTVECFKKVKSDCIKFIKSQETSKEKMQQWAWLKMKILNLQKVKIK